MTEEEIHNIYLHMSGKAEGLVEATGTADFPVLFARAILEYGGLTKDVENMASKSTYKEALETKDEPVAVVTSESGANVTHSWWHEPALPIGTKLYTSPQRTWVGLTYEEETELIRLAHNHAGIRFYIQAAEAKLKEKNI
jgi:hypothetical protein